MILDEKGITRKGKLECIEKNKQNRKIHYTSIDEETKERLKSQYEEIKTFYKLNIPQRQRLRQNAKMRLL